MRSHPLIQAAREVECTTGAKSPQRAAHERGHKILATTEIWAAFHAKLAEVGRLSFERNGFGAILFVGDVRVKVSSVDKAFSLGKLQKRLGNSWQATMRR